MIVAGEYRVSIHRRSKSFRYREEMTVTGRALGETLYRAPKEKVSEN